MLKTFTMPDVDLAGLRAKAEAADGDFWFADDGRILEVLDQRDMTFVAAASPSVVIGLLNRIQELEDQLSTGGQGPAPQFGEVEDGMGSSELRCKADCGLEVVRPGKFQCWCEHDSQRRASIPVSKDPVVISMTVALEKVWALTEWIDAQIGSEDYARCTPEVILTRLKGALGDD